jgi:hypothetical protein
VVTHGVLVGLCDSLRVPLRVVPCLASPLCSYGLQIVNT